MTGAENGARSGVYMTIRGPAGASEFQQQDAAQGKFGFTAGEGGVHRVCFASSAPAQRSVELDFQSGVDAKDYADLAKKEHLRPLELQLRKMEDRMETVHREMMFAREREEKHRDTNESTNSRVQWFSVLTISVVLATAAFQVQHLHSYLRRNKFFDR